MSTIKVLSIDGGGMRGLISTTWMDLFVARWGINPNEIYKYFDVISGASIGAIQAMGYALGLSPTEISSFFTTDGPWIFTTDTSTPSVVPSDISKANTIINGPFANPTFYPSATTGIGTSREYDALTSVFGSNKLSDLLTNVLITSFEYDQSNPDFAQSSNTPIYFSNVSSTIVPGLIGQTANCVDVGMATSAAPLYFAPYTFTLPGAGSPATYLDGGIAQNNPASFGLTVGKALKPAANRFVVLNIGSGLGDVGFPPAFLKRSLVLLKENPELFAHEWKVPKKEMEFLLKIYPMILEGAYLTMYLLGAAIAGPQEIVAKELSILAYQTLENLFNYRMQYYLSSSYDTDLDISDSGTLAYYTTSATNQFNGDLVNIDNFIAHLDAA